MAGNRRYSCKNCGQDSAFRIFLSSADVDTNGNVVNDCPRDHTLMQCLGCEIATPPDEMLADD